MQDFIPFQTGSAYYLNHDTAFWWRDQPFSKCGSDFYCQYINTFINLIVCECHDNAFLLCSFKIKATLATRCFIYSCKIYKNSCHCHHNIDTQDSFIICCTVTASLIHQSCEIHQFCVTWQSQPCCFCSVLPIMFCTCLSPFVLYFTLYLHQVFFLSSCPVQLFTPPYSVLCILFQPYFILSITGFFLLSPLFSSRRVAWFCPCMLRFWTF